MIENILAWVLEALIFICNLLFGWFQLPSFPIELTDSINSFLDLLFNNLSLLGLFIRPVTFNAVIYILISLYTFKILYKVIFWIIKKIPFLNIK
mgnify:CR=1 FL=1